MQFCDVTSAVKAHLVMHGREFGTQKVSASYYPLQQLLDHDLGPCLYESKSPPPVADTSVADTSVADTSVADTLVADISVADNAIDSEPPVIELVVPDLD